MLELPYKVNEFSMVIILPAKHLSLNEFKEKHLNYVKLKLKNANFNKFILKFRNS